MIYISGPITKNKNWESDFLLAEVFLAKNYYDTFFNPSYEDKKIQKEIEKPTYKDYMIHDIKGLLRCEKIYMLRGWWRSKGARLEHHIARVLGMKIIYQKRWEK